MPSSVDNHDSQKMNADGLENTLTFPTALCATNSIYAFGACHDIVKIDIRILWHICNMQMIVILKGCILQILMSSSLSTHT